jgi:hypothetical protein
MYFPEVYTNIYGFELAATINSHHLLSTNLSKVYFTYIHTLVFPNIHLCLSALNMKLVNYTQSQYIKTIYSTHTTDNIKHTTNTAHTNQHNIKYSTNKVYTLHINIHANI